MFEVIAENLQPFDKYAQDAFSLNREALINFLAKLSHFDVQYLDLNLGPIKKDKEKIVAFFINTIEEVSNFGLLIDSPDSETIEIAINYATRKPIINGFSLEQKKLTQILPLAKKYDCTIVGLLMADGYIPNDVDSKILLAEQIIAEAESIGIKRSQIILDPIVAPLGWEDGVRHNMANIEFIRLAKSIFGEEIKIMVGLSNLTTRSAFGTNKGLLQSYFLSILFGAGLDMVMLNAFDEGLRHTVKFIKTLKEQRIFSFADFL